MFLCTDFLKSLNFVAFSSFCILFLIVFDMKMEFIKISLFLWGLCLLEQAKNSFSDIWHSKVICETFNSWCVWLRAGMDEHSVYHQFILYLEVSFLKTYILCSVWCCIWENKRYCSYARLLVVVSWSESKILTEERRKHDQLFCLFVKSKKMFIQIIRYLSIFHGNFLLVQLMLTGGFTYVFFVMSCILQKLTKILLSFCAPKPGTLCELSPLFFSLKWEWPICSMERKATVCFCVWSRYS